MNNTTEICHPTYTQEWAENQYESLNEGYCMKYDFDNKSVSKIIRRYQVGSNHPITGVNLESPLNVVRYAPLIRETSFMDDSDENRCQGAIGWKSARYSGDSFASKCGITGSVSYQCANWLSGGDGFCAKCDNKTPCKNFFGMKYPKTSLGDDIPASDFFTTTGGFGFGVMDLSE